MNMRSFLQFASISAIIVNTRACAPTDPGTIPGGPTTTTTTLPPCCNVHIIMETVNRALFEPALVACPHDANFICSPDTDLSTKTIMIVVNDNETIATGAMGMNCFAMLTCNDQKKWQTAKGTIVESIACKG